MKSTSFAPALACGVLLACGLLAASPVLAQANAPAAGGKTLAIGGGGSGGANKPILTRDELRACFNAEAAIRTRIASHEAARAPLDAERQQIAADQEALKAERAGVDQAVAQAEAFKAKMAAHAERVKAWNAEVTAFNDRPPTGPGAERVRVRINTERAALEKAQAELEAERQKLQAGNQAVVDAYNAKSKALQERVAEWNQRNSAWNDAGRQIETDRQGWVDECSDRRYREDDEIAIRAGR